MNSFGPARLNEFIQAGPSLKIKSHLCNLYGRHLYSYSFLPEGLHLLQFSLFYFFGPKGGYAPRHHLGN